MEDRDPWLWKKSLFKSPPSHAASWPSGAAFRDVVRSSGLKKGPDPPPLLLLFVFEDDILGNLYV